MTTTKIKEPKESFFYTSYSRVRKKECMREDSDVVFGEAREWKEKREGIEVVSYKKEYLSNWKNQSQS